MILVLVFLCQCLKPISCDIQNMCYFLPDIKCNQGFQYFVINVIIILFLFFRFCLSLEPRLNLKQTWKSYRVRYCVSFFHTWAYNQEKVQLRLANVGLTLFEMIQISRITFATKEVLRSSRKGLKIWNGIGQDGRH